MLNSASFHNLRKSSFNKRRKEKLMKANHFVIVCHIKMSTNLHNLMIARRLFIFEFNNKF